MRTALIIIGVLVILIPEEIPDFSQKVEDTKSSYSEKDTWESFAHWVEDSDEIEIPDTDFVLRMAARLKQRGVVKDISRLDKFAGENSVMSASTKDKVVSALRDGKDD